MDYTIFILSSIGTVLSLYSFLVKTKIKNKNYKPLCDISEKISCSKAFASKKGELFKMHNSTIGIFFYAILIILSFTQYLQIIFYLSIIGIAFSVYLAFISYIKMKNFCIICSAIYAINFLIFVFSI